MHEIRGWTDLKNRLEADRRCFAFFHPRMPDEPLIFVEVALTRGISDSIHPLLDESAPIGDPAGADTAIFYSISNCQKGLAGISFGNFLIKRVVDNLAAELPRLKAFSTLSPTPGFRSWLDELLAAGEEGVLNVAEQRAINTLPRRVFAACWRRPAGTRASRSCARCARLCSGSARVFSCSRRQRRVARAIPSLISISAMARGWSA